MLRIITNFTNTCTNTMFSLGSECTKLGEYCRWATVWVGMRPYRVEVDFMRKDFERHPQFTYRSINKINVLNLDCRQHKIWYLINDVQILLPSISTLNPSLCRTIYWSGKENCNRTFSSDHVINFLLIYGCWQNHLLKSKCLVSYFTRSILRYIHNSYSLL